MPYELKRVIGGWKVFKQGTQTSYSDKPMPRHRAEEQMRALYAAESQKTSEGTDQFKANKAAVDYREATSLMKACGACNNYVPNGSCTRVAGYIDAGDVCNLFEPNR